MKFNWNENNYVHWYTVYIYLKTKFAWGGGKTPDIVIAHKSKGIMIFEVKDIDIKNYSRRKFKDK